MEIMIGRVKEYFSGKNKKAILKNYYSKELRKGKTYRASFLDRFFLILIVSIILFLILTIKSQNILLSLYISIITIFFLFNLIKLFLDKRKKERINKINEELKKERLIRELSHLNKEGFIEYSKILLEEFYDTNIDIGESPLDLICTIGDKTYGIRSYKIGMDDRVRLKDLEMFQEEFKDLALDRGIAITNSYFRDENYEKLNIKMYDLDKIIEILKEIGRYPNNEEIEEYILDNYLSKRNKIKKEFKVISIKKILQLYGISGVLYIFSYFINYPVLYKFISVICFICATVISGYKINEYIELRDEKL